MRLQCPCCGEQFPFEAGFADAEGKQLAALFADLEPRLGRAVLAYLRLFSPAKRSLRTTKAIKLVEELMLLVNAGSVTRDARTNDSKPASPALWAAGIEQMLAQRERLSLPLDNHHYLRAVVFGIANDPQQAQHHVALDPAELLLALDADMRAGRSLGGGDDLLSLLRVIGNAEHHRAQVVAR